jgi:hypothetical protein
MAIEIVRGSKIDRSGSQNLRQTQPQQHFQQQEMTPQGQDLNVVQRLGMSLLKGAELPGKLVSNTLEYLGEPPLIKEPLSEQIQRKHGISPEQLKSQGVLEDYAQKVAEYATTSAALGGLPGLASTAFGAVPATAAKEFGLPEWAQDLAQFGSEIGLGIYKGRIPTLAGIGKGKGKIKSVQSAQQNAYNAAKSAVQNNEEFIAKPISDSMIEVGKALGTEVDSSIITKVNQALETIEKNLVGGKVNPKTALELRKKLYRLGGKVGESTARTYFDPLTKGINDFFITYGLENPKFYEQLYKADRLTEAKHMQSYLANFVKGLPKIPYISKPIQQAFNLTVGASEKFVKNLISNEAYREHFANALKATFKEDPSILFKNVEQLQQDILASQNQDTYQFKRAKPKKTYEIIKGHKL